jgi:hypothetical protein
MTRMNHTDIQPLLADYRDLRGAERAAVDAHAVTCDLCAARLADYGAMDVAIQSLRDAPADPRLSSRYFAALAAEHQPAPRPRRVWPYALAAAAVTLIVIVGVWTLLRPTGPGGTPRVAQDAVPAAKSAEVGAFVWQTDGVYGYRMLRPAGWEMAVSGQARHFVGPSVEGETPISLNAANLRAIDLRDLAEVEANAIASSLAAFDAAQNIEGWAAAIEQRVFQSYARATLPYERVPLPPDLAGDAAVYLFKTDGYMNRPVIMPYALKVSDGQPLVVSLYGGTKMDTFDALQASGAWDDFLTILRSLTAVPVDPENVSPWAPTATPTPTNPPRTLLPTSTPVVAVTAQAEAYATPTPDPRLIIWPGWEQFEQELGRAVLTPLLANRVCDWSVLGRNGNDIYVWAYCAAFNPAPTINAASMPAVLRVSENNMAVGALVPREGAYYSEDVAALFPAEIQPLVLSQTPGTAAPELVRHARLRLNWPMLPPFGAAEVAPVDPDALGAKASVRIFSGRADPAWMFTHRELDQLDALLRELNTIACPPIPDRLGYRGAQAILGPGDAGMLVAADGYVWAGDAASNPDALCLADPQRNVERLLLSSSQPYVDADTFNLLSTLLPEPLPTPLVSPTPTPTLAPNWVMYGDEGLDIQLRHPDVWEVGTTTDLSRVWQMKAAASESGEAPMAPPPFWVTILPPNYDNADARAYNFWSAEETAQAWNTRVGETFVNAHAPEGYNTYTRLADITVDGFPAAVVESQRVWEMPAETRDARVLVKVGGMTVAFGSYYQDEAEYVAFMRVLESVKFGSRVLISGGMALTPEVPQPAP